MAVQHVDCVLLSIVIGWDQDDIKSQIYSYLEGGTGAQRFRFTSDRIAEALRLDTLTAASACEEMERLGILQSDGWGFTIADGAYIRI